MRESNSARSKAKRRSSDVRSALAHERGPGCATVSSNGEVRIVKPASVRNLKGLLARPGARRSRLDAMEPKPSQSSD